MSGTVQDIENGKALIKGYRDDGSIIALNVETKKSLPKSQWDYMSHDARSFGTKFIKSILGDNRFTFPKSIFAVYDCLKLATYTKPNALILDFFAGSGTTLNAVNLLNAADHGSRRCIMVTNNEVSEEEARMLTSKGFRPGDIQWDKYGIARYVTWPRTINSIKGVDENGNLLQGSYSCEVETFKEVVEDGLLFQAGSGKASKVKLFRKTKSSFYPEFSNRKISDGFRANAIFFKLGFLDKMKVGLGGQFWELLPVLWLKAGAIGPCPEVKKDVPIPSMLIFPSNRMAVLFDGASFSEFKIQLKKHKDIDVVYIVTDNERSYQSMISELNVNSTYQLYRDYLDNFRINQNRV